MKSQLECQVSGPIASALRVSRCMGLAPLRFTRTSNGWTVRIFRRFYIVGFVLAAIVNVITTWIIVTQLFALRFITGTRLTLVVSHGVEMFMLMLTWTVMVHNSRKHMRCTITCLNQVRKLTTELKVLQWWPEWKKPRIEVYIAWLIISLMFIFIDSFFALSILTESAWIKVAYIIDTFYRCGKQSGITSFISLVLHVRTSFKAVNYCLKNLLKGDISDSNPHHETVHRIASAYASACDVVRDVNRSYGLMLMALLTGIFLQLVTAMYYFINNLVRYANDTEGFNWFVMRETLQFFWIVFHATNLIMVIEPCHLTRAEIEYTSILVSRLMRRVNSIHEPLAIELEQFCRQLELNDISYRPLNITTMERGLVLAIFGSITTYLVILIDI